MQKHLNKAVLILLIFKIIVYPITNNVNAQDGWFEIQPDEPTFNHIFDLSFISKDTGWVSGWTTYNEGSRLLIIKTINGGITWDSTLFTMDLSAKMINFYNDSYGFVGESNILRTLDSGKTWEVVFMGAPKALNRIAFSDSLHIWSVGTYGTIVKSSDGGDTWQYLENNIEENRFGGLSVLDSLTVYTISNEHLIFTEDGGITWSDINIPQATRYQNVYFIDKYYGWIVGDYRTVYRTEDGGNTWVDQSPPADSDSFLGIDALNKDVAVVTSSHGAILRTNDGGNTWEEQASKWSYSIIRSVQIIDENIAYAVSQDGRILKTITGGVTDIKSIDAPQPNNYYLSQNYPNPFNPGTTISYSVPAVQSGYIPTVRIIIYDILGREVKRLVNTNQAKGVYEIEFNGDNFSSGIYYYKLISGNFTATKKMLLIK
jgi:photosystem II stability/assembly factor-like uncharacterized protein